MRKVVLGLVQDQNQAQRVVNELVQSGFSSDSISILLANHKEERREFKTSTRDYSLESEEITLEERNADNSPKSGKGGLGIEKHTKASEGAASGATAGGILGGALGLLAGIGTIAIPGLGALVAAGPLLGLLSGSAVGGGLGLLIGALAGLGIPEFEAKKYEKGLKEGQILLAVEANTSDEINEITRILKKLDVKNISSTTETTRSR